MTPGQLLRDARRRHGVSQTSLATRAGTTQSAISRIERDRVSPTVETLRTLLHLVGEDLELTSRERDSGIDRTLIEQRLALPPGERVRRGLEFSRFVRRNRGAAVGVLEARRQMTEQLPPDLSAEPILDTLRRHAVDFVVIGGLAGMAHGSTFPTFDLDVAYSRDRSNLERLAAALRELGARLRTPGDEEDLPFQLDARSLENGANFTFRTRFGNFDVLADPGGIRSYEELRAAARDAVIEGVPVLVASIDHLIAMKRTAARPKDKIMVEEYIALADEQRRLDDPKGDSPAPR